MDGSTGVARWAHSAFKTGEGVAGLSGGTDWVYETHGTYGGP